MLHIITDLDYKCRMDITPLQSNWFFPYRRSLPVPAIKWRQQFYSVMSTERVTDCCGIDFSFTTKVLYLYLIPKLRYTRVQKYFTIFWVYRTLQDYFVIPLVGWFASLIYKSMYAMKWELYIFCSRLYAIL